MSHTDPLEVVELRDSWLLDGNLAAAVSMRIQRDIIDMGWPVGAVVGSEPELLDRYGVSRPVLRQAVRILESQGVARMRRGPGGGLIIGAPDGSSVASSVALFLEFLRVEPELVRQARASIELTCVELAAREIGGEGIATLRDLVSSEPERVAESGLLALQALHVEIARLSGNPVLGLFVHVLTELSRAQAPHIPDAEAAKGLEDVYEEHRLIADAIIAGDGSLACHHMRLHVPRFIGREKQAQDPCRLGVDRWVRI